jgi:hypothetical protein
VGARFVGRLMASHVIAIQGLRLGFSAATTALTTPLALLGKVRLFDKNGTEVRLPQELRAGAASVRI